MKGYQEFPKMMRHPNAQPAVLAKWDYTQKDPEKQRQGAPARFPDVMVNNEDQEAQYAAKGYVPAGVSDPEAYRRAITGNEKKPASTFVEFPKYLYRMEDDVLEDRLVESAEQEAALGPGWYETPGKAASAGEQRQAKSEEKLAEKPAEGSDAAPPRKVRQPRVKKAA